MDKRELGRIMRDVAKKAGRDLYVNPAVYDLPYEKKKIESALACLDVVDGMLDQDVRENMDKAEKAWIEEFEREDIVDILDGLFMHLKDARNVGDVNGASSLARIFGDDGSAPYILDVHDHRHDIDNVTSDVLDHPWKAIRVCTLPIAAIPIEDVERAGGLFASAIRNAWIDAYNDFVLELDPPNGRYYDSRTLRHCLAARGTEEIVDGLMSSKEKISLGVALSFPYPPEHRDCQIMRWLKCPGAFYYEDILHLDAKDLADPDEVLRALERALDPDIETMPLTGTPRVG